MVAHSPDNPSGLKAQWPPQPRASEATPWVNRHTLSHHAPRKGKSKHNTLCFNTFSLSRAQASRHIIPRVSLRLPWAMNFCPFGTSPLKRALIERFSACERIRVDLCDLWACSPNCLFKRIEHLVFTPTDPTDLHRFLPTASVPSPSLDRLPSVGQWGFARHYLPLVGGSTTNLVR